MTAVGERDPSKIARSALGMTRQYEQITRSKSRVGPSIYSSLAMTKYAKLPTWADKSHVYAVVETPRGSRAKLEFDSKLRVFTLAKPLLTDSLTLMTGDLSHPRKLTMVIQSMCLSFTRQQLIRAWCCAVSRSESWKSRK